VLIFLINIFICLDDKSWEVGGDCPQILWKKFYLTAVFTLNIAEIVLNINQSTAVMNEKFG
jgi:hypothetical protein